MNMRSFENPEERGTPIPLPMKKGDILLFSNMTFHGSKINHTDEVRWSIDIRYTRTPGTFDAPQEVLESEAFMHEKLRKTKRPPLIVRGQGETATYDEWMAAFEALRN